MAPPSFPQGMTLHSIGYAALRYPQLPSDCPVPLANQVGVLQRIPHSQQNQMIAQIASQYVDAFIAHQTSDDPLIHDPASPQYYFSTTLCMLNFITTSPDVCIRIARNATVLHDVVEKLLSTNFVENMKRCDRSGPPGFQSQGFAEDFGSLIQFVSTVLLYSEEIPALHPRIQELIPKLQVWKREYRNSHVRTISNASERLVTQIRGMDPTLIQGMHQMQRTSLVCGVASCGKSAATDTLTACAKCKIQRYCGAEHQRQDWKYHKHICAKGLVPLTGEGDVQ